MKTRKLLLTALALSLVLALGIGGTWAYFTTYAEAKGDKEIGFKYEADIEETVTGLEKDITIVVKDESQPVYARVKAYTGSEYKLDTTASSDWTLKDDGYCYYNKVLYANDNAKGLKFKLAGIPEDAEDGLTANIVVLYETTPVFFVEKDGKMVPSCDWTDNKLDRTIVEGGEK